MPTPAPTAASSPYSPACAAHPYPLCCSRAKQGLRGLGEYRLAVRASGLLQTRALGTERSPDA